MHATFISEGKVYNYVESQTDRIVQAREIVDFGVKDSKGRAVGMMRRINHETRTLRAERPLNGGWIWPVGAPLERFAGFACSTRDNSCFGSADIRVYGATEAEVAAELDKRIERARRIALKKHA